MKEYKLSEEAKNLVDEYVYTKELVDELIDKAVRKRVEFKNKVHEEYPELEKKAWTFNHADGLKVTDI